MSPMDITKIQVDGTVLVLKEALSLAVSFDPEGQEFVMEYPEMGIVTGAENRDELLNDFCEDFYWVWQEYGKGDTSTMSEGAVKLSQRVKGMVSLLSSTDA